VTRPRRSEFDPDDLHGSVIAAPLIALMAQEKAATVHSVVIDLNYRYPGGLKAAADRVRGYAEHRRSTKTAAVEAVSPLVSQYVFAWLTAASIRRIVRLDRANPPSAIYRIWPDFEIGPLINKSAQTVKAPPPARRLPRPEPASSGPLSIPALTAHTTTFRRTTPLTWRSRWRTRTSPT
jgi:serine protease AprX